MNAATLNQRPCPGLPSADADPLISIIIPAHNEEAYLHQTLTAINRQNYRSYEVIVVANGCSDRTAAVAQGHCDKLIVRSEKGLCRARNLGAEAAQGELLLFLDADTVLEKDALAKIARRFTHDYAAGTLKGRPDSDRLVYRLLYFLKNAEHRWSLHQGSSGVILCWRDHFAAVGGFNEALEVMENSDLFRKLRSSGRYLYIDETEATTSMRRYDKTGVGKSFRLWFKLWLQSLFGDLRYKQYETIR